MDVSEASILIGKVYVGWIYTGIDAVYVFLRRLYISRSWAVICVQVVYRRCTYHL